MTFSSLVNELKRVSLENVCEQNAKTWTKGKHTLFLLTEKVVKSEIVSLLPLKIFEEKLSNQINSEHLQLIHPSSQGHLLRMGLESHHLQNNLNQIILSLIF